MLSLQDIIAEFRKFPDFGKYFVRAFERIETAVNQGAAAVGVDPTGIADAPPPIQSLSVKQSNDGHFHIAITDNGAIQRNIQYFAEYDTSQNFTQPHVIYMGPARTHLPFSLPAQDDNGNPQTFYFRAYSQYPGSKPGKKVNFGGTTPTGVTPAGTTKLTLLPSTGSGTASGTGTQGGQGLGSFPSRPAPAPKRGGTPIGTTTL